MDEKLMLALRDYKRNVQGILKNHMKKMILYGSYARGDYRDDSDIDVMFLVDLSGDELEKTEFQVWDMTYDFNMDCGFDISTKMKNIDHFNYWKEDDAFFYNVDNEGVVI